MGTFGTTARKEPLYRENYWGSQQGVRKPPDVSVRPAATRKVLAGSMSRQCKTIFDGGGRCAYEEMVEGGGVCIMHASPKTE